MFNINLQQYVLAEGEVTGVSLWEEANERERERESGCQCYELQGLCTTTFGKEETVQMHQLEK